MYVCVVPPPLLSDTTNERNETKGKKQKKRPKHKQKSTHQAIPKVKSTQRSHSHCGHSPRYRGKNQESRQTEQKSYYDAVSDRAINQAEAYLKEIL